MPRHYDLDVVARRLRDDLNGRAFLTLHRLEVTRMIREVPGHGRTRMTKAVTADLQRALLEHGVRCFPSFEQTDSTGTIRLFHTPSKTADLVGALLYPSPETDRELAEILTKVKGKWDWSRQLRHEAV